MSLPPARPLPSRPLPTVPSRPRRHRSVLAGLVAALSATLLVGVIAGPASAAGITPPAPGVSKPVTPTGLPKASEGLASYVPAVGCDMRVNPGTEALGKLLKTTYPDTTYGLGRTCGAGTGKASEHTDGRAVDWMVSARTTGGLAKANAVIAWLFATDGNGVTFANARRLGTMYLIWNNKIWGAYSADAGWRPYNNCANTPQSSMDTACHRNHIHFSLSWEGAMKKTSFWTKTVAAKEYGPCRAADMNWSGRYSVRYTPCPRYPAVTAPAGSSTVMKNLVRFSGITLVSGDSGPAVAAVQSALKVSPVNGVFGPMTLAAVKAFKAKQGGRVAPNGAVGAGTWRALMKANAPK
ncbi:MAG TPA: peptidoglycan-binding domain-containing protein [Actinopolymorphaceae bacterium]|jgi:hypothetical protein